jgi:hypothetical protein
MIPVPDFHQFYDSGDFFIIGNNKISGKNVASDYFIAGVNYTGDKTF